MWKDEGGNQEEMMSARKFRRYKTEEAEEMIYRRETLLALRNNVKSEKSLEVYGRLSQGIEMKWYLHRPMDPANTLKLRFRVGDLDLPERRKK